jgi:hypothetical protein
MPFNLGPAELIVVLVVLMVLGLFLRAVLK